MRTKISIASISLLSLFSPQLINATPPRETSGSRVAVEVASSPVWNQERKRAKLAAEVLHLEAQFKEICDVYNNYEKKSIQDKIKQNEEKINKIHSEIAMLVFIDQRENKDYKEDARIIKFRNMIHKLSDSTIVEHVSLYALNSPIAQRMKETEEKLRTTKLALERCKN